MKMLKHVRLRSSASIISAAAKDGVFKAKSSTMVSRILEAKCVLGLGLEVLDIGSCL